MTVFISAKTYLVGSVKGYGHTSIKGLGEKSILKQKSGAQYCLTFNREGGTPDINDNMTDITLECIKFQGTVVADGFNESYHLCYFNAVSRVFISDTFFEGWRGDALSFASSYIPATECHNEDVYITNCHFDGINNNNRQAITFIDINKTIIRDCTFKNCTKSTMPGAIDFEPNENNFSVIKNIQVLNNYFTNVGGNTGVINFHLPISQELLTTPCKNIQIKGNTIENSLNTESGVVFVQVTATGILDSTPEIGLNISDNIIRNVIARSFIIININVCTIENNMLMDCLNQALISYVGSNSLNVKLKNNIFLRCGSVSGNGLVIYAVSHLLIDGNMFVDCGEGIAGAANAIDFGSNSLSDNVTIVNNMFSTPNGMTQIAIQKEATHTFAVSTNIFYNNNLGSLINSFQAYRSDNCVVNVYDTTVLPDSFPTGISQAVVNGDAALPSVIKQGTLKTEVLLGNNTGYRKWIVQWYYPANNTGVSISDIYFRKGSATNVWTPWERITGIKDLSGSVTWDPADLTDGTGETSASITVTGASLGDYAICSAPYDLRGITCNAYVDNTNSVKIRLQNETGGSINLASGTWKVKVTKT